MYSDAVLIIFIACFTALLGEGLTWVLVYRFFRNTDKILEYLLSLFKDLLNIKG
jgi:hypothetical protein